MIKKKNLKNYFFQKLNVADLENLDKNLESIIKKFSCPNIFINFLSYKFQLEFKFFQKNKILNLRKKCRYSSKLLLLVCAHNLSENEEKKILGSVILLNSIYGFLGQNMSIYKNTTIEENMNYSIIKGGILNFSRQLASFYSPSD